MRKSSRRISIGDSEGSLRRHFLSQQDLTGEMFSVMDEQLFEKGLRLWNERSGGATIIQAPSSSKSGKKERDPEMKSLETGSLLFASPSAFYSSSQWPIQTYFPIQNVEKILVSISSVVVSPVIWPRYLMALWRPMSTISSLIFCLQSSIDWRTSASARTSRS